MQWKNVKGFLQSFGLQAEDEYNYIGPATYGAMCALARREGCLHLPAFIDKVVVKRDSGNYQIVVKRWDLLRRRWRNLCKKTG